MKPTFNIANIEITQISCGGNHNLVLTNKNEIYSWGYGDMLALGHGDEKDEILPKKLNFDKAKIKNITITQVSIHIYIKCCLLFLFNIDIWRRSAFRHCRESSNHLIINLIIANDFFKYIFI